MINLSDKEMTNVKFIYIFMLRLFSYIRTSNDNKCVIAINRQYKIMNNDYCTENYDEERIKKIS